MKYELPLVCFESNCVCFPAHAPPHNLHSALVTKQIGLYSLFLLFLRTTTGLNRESINTTTITSTPTTTTTTTTTILPFFDERCAFVACDENRRLFFHPNLQNTLSYISAASNHCRVHSDNRRSYCIGAVDLSLRLSVCLSVCIFRPLDYLKI